MNIDDKSETELKALIFDQMVILEQTQHNIAVLKTELKKRTKDGDI